MLAPGIAGPEDVAISADGKTLYASSYRDGKLMRIDVGGDNAVTVHAITGGNPTDIAVRADGTLLLCDWGKGLLAVSETGEVTTVLALGTMVDGRPFVRPDGVSEAADGTLYISEGSARPGVWNGTFESLEGRFYGRVFTYQPGTGELRTVVKDVGFANGNAIDPTGQFLVIADTIRYRILRLWLAGTKAGEVDEFASNLPGFPHNIHYDDAGLLWVGSWMERNSMLDWLSSHPRVNKHIAKLPDAAVAGPEHLKAGKPGRGALMALDSTGSVVKYLDGPPARVDSISAAVRSGNTLYLGTLTGDAILRLTITI